MSATFDNSLFETYSFEWVANNGYDDTILDDIRTSLHEVERLRRVEFDLRLALENIWKWSEEDSVPPGKYFEEEARMIAQWALDHAGEVSDEEPTEAVEF